MSKILKNSQTSCCRSKVLRLLEALTSVKNYLFNNHIDLNKVCTECQCLKTIIIQARIRLYRVENFLKKNKHTYMIIWNLRVWNWIKITDYFPALILYLSNSNKIKLSKQWSWFLLFLRPIILKLHQTFEDWNDATTEGEENQMQFPRWEIFVYPWNFYPLRKKCFPTAEPKQENLKFLILILNKN